MSHKESPTYIVFAFTKKGAAPVEVHKSRSRQAASVSANFWDERVDVALYQKVGDTMTFLAGREHPDLVNEEESRWAVVARDWDGQVLLEVQDATGSTQFPKGVAEKLSAEKQAALVGDLYRYEVVLTN